MDIVLCLVKRDHVTRILASDWTPGRGAHLSRYSLEEIGGGTHVGGRGHLLKLLAGQLRADRQLGKLRRGGHLRAVGGGAAQLAGLGELQSFSSVDVILY